MIVKKRRLDGVFEIQLESHEDNRGFFMRTYDDKTFENYDINKKWVQENHSFSVTKDIVRGLHFQFPPHSETKLIRVVNGEIYDVFVDLRKNSSMFGRWDGIKLSNKNKKMIFIPRGFAHGFCTLTKNCNVLYKVDNYYSPKHEGSIRWDDPDLAINWPVKKPILSKKDLNAKTFKEFCEEYGGLEVKE